MENVKLTTFLGIFGLGIFFQGTLTVSSFQEDENFKTLNVMLDEMKQDIDKLNIKFKNSEASKEIMAMRIQEIETKNLEMEKEIYDLKANVSFNQNGREIDQKSIRLVEKDIEESQKKSTPEDFIYRGLREETKVLGNEISMLKSTARGQEQEIRRMRDPPIVYYCGFNTVYDSNSHVVPYSSPIFYSYSNQETGGLEPSTGIFTAPVSGTFRVTYSNVAQTDPGKHDVEIYIQKNGASIPESYQYSRYTGPSGGVRSGGGLSMLLHLDLGETVALYCDDCSAMVSKILFCVNLEQFDP